MDAKDFKEKTQSLLNDYFDSLENIFDTDTFIDPATLDNVKKLNTKLEKDINRLDTDLDSNVILVRLDNMVLRDKLETFLRDEVFTFHKEYDNCVYFL